MDSFYYIFDSIPLLKHFNEKERSFLAALGRISRVKTNQIIDLKKISALNVILEGVFELEVFGKKEYIYLTPGSFFGDYPFTDIKNRGTIKAVSEARLLQFNTEDLYKFFFTNYRALRGYIRSLENLGMDLSSASASHFKRRTKIVTVFGTGNREGKSLFAASLALTLAERGATILLDMSYGGESVYTFFEKRPPAPLSQKQEESDANEQFIVERLEHAAAGLDLLNVLHGSNVKASPSILSPLLFLLSKSYKYIIVDLSNSDGEIRDRVFEESHIILGLVTRMKNRDDLSAIFNDSISNGQRVYYLLNTHFHDKTVFEGGFRWESIGPNEGTDSNFSFDAMKESVPKEIPTIISSPVKALVLEANGLDAWAYAGLYDEILNTGVLFDIHYCSSFAFLFLFAFLTSQNADEYKKTIKRFYPWEKINELLDITFPKNVLFKSAKIARFATELAKDARLEYFPARALLLASSKDFSRRIFSTGNMEELIQVSMSAYPFFEAGRIGNGKYISGYPFTVCSVEDIMPLDVDTVAAVSVKPRIDHPGASGILPIFLHHHEYFDSREKRPFSSPGRTARLELEWGEDEKDPEKILEIVRTSTNKFLKENRFI